VDRILKCFEELLEMRHAALQHLDAPFGRPVERALPTAKALQHDVFLYLYGGTGAPGGGAA
jgi:hypothetical protein